MLRKLIYTKRMNQKGFAVPVALIIIVIALVGALGYVAFVKKSMPPAQCTLEAKLCPDGSAVGRVGPNCEFAPCPNILLSPQPTAPAGWETFRDADSGIEVRYPADRFAPVNQTMAPAFFAGDPSPILLLMPRETVARAGEMCVSGETGERVPCLTLSGNYIKFTGLVKGSESAFRSCESCGERDCQLSLRTIGGRRALCLEAGFEGDNIASYLVDMGQYGTLLIEWRHASKDYPPGNPRFVEQARDFAAVVETLRFLK